MKHSRSTWGCASTPSTTITGLVNPNGIAVDAGGDLYTVPDVASVNGGVISEYVGSATTASKTIAGLATLSGVAVYTPPTPLAVVALSQLVGDFTQKQDGSSGITTSAPLQIANLAPGTDTAVVAGSRKTMSASAPSATRTLPSGGTYLAPPETLPENDALLSDFVSFVKSKSLVGQLIPACYAYLEEQRASADLTSPYNPAYYQIQTYCENGGSIVPGSLTSTWQGLRYAQAPTYSGPLTGTVSVVDVCTSADTNNLGLQKCFSKVQLLPVALALAEINTPSSLTFKVAALGLQFSFNADYFGNTAEFYINNRSVPYPVVPVKTSWGPSARNGNPNVPTPTATYGPYMYTASGCRNPDASTALNTNLTAAGFPRPAPGFQPHHINSTCFGGVDMAYNGIWLPTNAAGQPNLHQILTTWMLPANITP